MTERTFASLVPRVSASTPGCPYPTVLQHIRESAIRTCESTLAWRWVQPKMTLSPGVPDYEYAKPQNTAVHAVFFASLNDYPLEILTLDRAGQLYPEWVDYFSGVDPATLWAQEGLNTEPLNATPLNNGAPVTLPPAALEKCSEPRSLTQVTPDRFVVLPAPDASKTFALRLIYALKPVRNASGMDQTILDDLEDAIVHGALQHLLLLPDSPWSSERHAVYHAKQFVSQCAERRARANLGNQRGVMRVKMVPFG